MRRFLLKLLGLALPLLAMVAAVNYAGDAGGLFLLQERTVARYMLDGLHVRNASNMDERLLQRLLIDHLPHAPECIVLGSSRVMLFDSEICRAGDFMNHAVSGASVEDLIGVYQLYRNRGVYPSRVVIGVDPWIFNDESDQHRWRVLQDAYSEFTSEPFLVPHEVYALKRWTQLLSPSYFQRSSRALLARNGRETRQAVPTTSPVNEEFTKHADGSIAYDAGFRSADSATVEVRARGDLRPPVYSLEGYLKISARRLRGFQLLVTDMRARGIHVTFVLVPYHPVVFDELSRTSPYRIILQFEQAVRRLAAEQQIPVVGSMDPAAAGLNRTHFYDGMHLNEAGVALLLRPLREDTAR